MFTFIITLATLAIAGTGLTGIALIGYSNEVDLGFDLLKGSAIAFGILCIGGSIIYM